MSHIMLDNNISLNWIIMYMTSKSSKVLNLILGRFEQKNIFSDE